MDFEDLSTERLLKLLIVALEIHIPRLHNALVTVLLNRHRNVKPGLLDDVRDDEETPPFELVAAPALLAQIYKLTPEKSPERRMVAFLLAQAGVTMYGGYEDWEYAVSRDIGDVLERVHAGENVRGWGAIFGSVDL